ncbi:hypothetical protein F7725_000797 [Dissostichus mawsoni]|uniref:Endonuclease/exonuclease/phosphatase domain-containing protein n=1 Tax=Dissostichus mawsoni TaxID=36200 RepID=A0A7J5ZFF3_DISMA|nr:hypothetical protein F7725_000797 [Dissostichus mawsoni]
MFVALCFRKKEVEIIDSYQYGGNDEDVITRQPFVVLLKCPNTVVQDLVLIPVHTKPTDAEAELNALHDVVEDNIMILGDFNADRPHLSNEQKETLLISSAPYHWLIDDDVVTMTRNNNHTYDRIVVYGERMLEAIVPKSAKAYNFEEELNLTDEQVELEVKSEMELKVKLIVENMGKLELMVKQEVEQEVELTVKLMVENMGKLEVEMEQMVEQMMKQKRKLEQKAQRKRVPV